MTTIKALGLAALLAAAGCNPVLVPTPLQLGETAPALGAGDVSITGQAGGGTAVLDGSGFGAAGRVRVGVGHQQEVGVEGFFAYADTGKQRYSGQFGGGKASYKLELDPHFALIAGAGFGTGTTGTSVGGDLAALVSGASALRPYLGVRGAYGVRVTGTGDNVVALSVPFGISLAVSDTVRIFGEAGAGLIHSGGPNAGPFYLSAGLSVVLPRPSAAAR